MTTTAPHKTQSPASLRKDGTTPGQLFVSMALDMSWRLAVAVLAPIIGGVELDKAFKTSPWLLIIGFVLAMVGMAAVMRRSLRAANRQPVPQLTAAQKRAIKKSYDEEDDD